MPVCVFCRSYFVAGCSIELLKMGFRMVDTPTLTESAGCFFELGGEVSIAMFGSYAGHTLRVCCSE